MNRQNVKCLLGAVCLLFVLIALPGCSHRQHKTATIEVIMHAPAITTTFEPDGSDGISVFVPRDDQKQHEFVIPDMVTPGQPEKDDCEVTFHIKLVGVQSFHGQPTFASLSPSQAPPFRAISFKMHRTWTPSGEAFVTMIFPSVSSVGFLGPLYPVRFQSGLTSQVPLTEVLDFPTADVDEVRLVQTKITECGTAKQSQTATASQAVTHSQEVVYRPLKCEKAAELFRKYSIRSVPPETAYSERPSLKERLENCTAGTYFYFLGVGLPPNSSSDPNAFRNHGITFYNEKLLPAVFGSEDRVPADRRLVSVGEEAAPGLNQPTNQDGSPRLVPAEFPYRSMRPRMIPVASTENCTAPGVLVTPQ